MSVFFCPTFKPVRHLLTLLLAVSTTLTFGQSFTVTKRLLSIEDGLASHEVFCGLQDPSGFLWFGTRNGLNRYDGKNCLLFTRQRNHLQDNKVVQLASDGAGRLFIEYGSTGFQLTTNGKVDVMDLATQEVKTLSAAFPGMPFKEKDVYWIAGDGTGEVNFLTAYPFRLWKYSANRGFRLRCQFKDWHGPDDYRTTGPLCLFAQGRSLVKIYNQSTQYLVTDDTVISFVQKDALRSLPLAFDNRNNLLIAYNTVTQRDAFSVGRVSLSGKTAFPADTLRSSEDSVKGRYWYACASDGSASALYIGTDAIYLYTENAFLKVIDRSEVNSFENLFLYQLFDDNLGNRWLCTSLGVFQLKVEKNRFTPFFTRKQQSAEANSQARGIYADATGRVVANIWRHTFGQRDGRLQTAAGTDIMYGVALHDSTLFCGGNNLYRYEGNRLAVCPGASGTEIWSLYSVNDSILALGRSDGIQLYNTVRGTAGPLSREPKFVYRIFRSPDDTLWAVAENGLYSIGRSIVRRSSPLVDGLVLLDAYAEGNGVFWLATNGEGLYRWDSHTNAFLQFNITSGLLSDVLYRIEPDGFGNLWISSDYGLIRFNKTTHAVTTYTTADGISHNEFNRTSSFRASDGRLFFGGIDGVNALDPKDFQTDTAPLNVPLRIISFSQFVGSLNRLVDKTADVQTTSRITLAPADRLFTLQVGLLDYATAHRYAYKIEGADRDWTYTDENVIRASGLPYGSFVLRVRAQNREGAWSTSELALALEVARPFYLTWWFICLAALSLVAAIYGIILFRTKQLAADKDKLEQTVNERTAQLKRSLSEQADLLTEKDVLLKEIHHRVKNNLQVVSGLLELQSKNLEDEAARDALREGRNRVRSIALIHQNLYRFEDLGSIELKRFIDDLCGEISGVYKKVALHIDVPSLPLDIDTAVPIGLILNELLTNSFKYAFGAGSAGEVSIRVRALAPGRYEMSYADNGPGLPADFDIARATTLGIQLIHDLARQIGGRVRYAGASFVITFTDRNFRKNQD